MNEARAIFDDEVLPLFAARNGGWIARARDAARQIAREKGRVTINDVRAVCPPPDGADPRIMGAVLIAPCFVRIGFAPSERRQCHGRIIGVFALKEPPSSGNL